MTKIKDLCDRLYGERAATTLYHYTSLSGLEAIMATRSLRASEIRYMNDTAELQHAGEVMSKEIARRVEGGTKHGQLLEQLNDWLLNRLEHGHMLFVVSYTTNGNLLSQWRGYGNVGKGVSLGFNPEAVSDCAALQSFQVGRCIYDHQRHEEIAAQVVSAIESLAAEWEEGAAGRPFNVLFESLEADLLRIATLLKHPSFREEDEWRVVSPVFTNCVKAPISYREGISMLVPYIEFKLDCRDLFGFEHIYLGPTPNKNLSMSSLGKFLSRQNASPTRGITYCEIPYRQW